MALFCLAAMLLLPGGCYQAQLFGPVAGARITVSELRDETAVLLRARAESRDALLRRHGEEGWEAFGPERRLWYLGVFRLEPEALRDDRLYLVTARGGLDTDRDWDGVEDDAYTPVAGRWRAIMSGAQLKRNGPKVSALTEAAYQWLRPQLSALDDLQIMFNLDRAAVATVADVNNDGVVSGTDLLHWSRLFDRDKLLADVSALDRLAAAVIEDEGGGVRRQFATALLDLPVDRNTAASQFLPALVRGQLADQDFDRFLALSWRWLLQRSPEDIVRLGVEADYGAEAPLLDDVSDEFEAVTATMAAVMLERLRNYERPELDREQRLSRDIFEWYLEDIVDAQRHSLVSYPASSFITGVPYSTRFFFTDIHPLASIDDAEDYLVRLGQVAGKFEQLRDKVARRAQAGIVEPAVTLEWAIDALRSTAGGRSTSSPYYERLDGALAAMPGIDGAAAEAMRERAIALLQEEVQPAYRALISDLEALRPQAPSAIGVNQFAGGEAYYDWALRHHTSTGQGPRKIHQTGLDEVARVRRELELAARDLGYPGGLGLVDLFERIAADGGVFEGEQILQGYEQLVRDAASRLEEAFDLLPRQQVVVIGGPTGGFYVRGSEDGSRPGAFYAATTGEQPRYSMASLAYHEALPGHHLQIALAREQALPEFRRHTGNTGYIEGWALYAERLAYELGWYRDDPYGNLGRLQFELIRAVRLVMDTGIHHYGWSWDRAVDYYRENTGSSLRTAQGNVGRFMRWPGQATAYLVGMNRLLDLRAAAGIDPADEDSLKAFHRLVLSGGAMPLGILAKVVQREAGGG